MSCCVPKCFHRSGLSRNRPKPNGRKVSFHCIPPSNNPLRQKWLDAISSGKTNFVITPASKVCSCHFSEDMYYSGVANDRRLLKSDAIPHLFAWGNYSSSVPRASNEELPLEDSTINDIQTITITSVKSESEDIAEVILSDNEIGNMQIQKLERMTNCNCSNLTKEVVTLQLKCIFLEKKVKQLENENKKLQSGICITHQKK